jgi:hypothetical protein
VNVYNITAKTLFYNLRNSPLHWRRWWPIATGLK